jgi:DtxR family Mn-dependent transcriptional regulator
LEAIHVIAHHVIAQPLGRPGQVQDLPLPVCFCFNQKVDFYENITYNLALPKVYSFHGYKRISTDMMSIPREHLTSHQATEDYLKSIYLLAETESPVSTSRLAQARGVRPASATNMIQRLSGIDLVNYRKHYGVTLTEAGRQIALKLIRHHRLLECYLVEALDFGWEEVHEEAEALEHVISDRFVERMADKLDHPKFDPHGEPIPTKDGAVIDLETRLLTTLPVGARAIVIRISDDTNRELLRYLADLGLMPGAAVTLVEMAPFDGPLTLAIDGKGQVLGHKAAAAVHVRPEKDEG